MKKIVSLFLVLLMVFGTVATLSSCASKDAGAHIDIYLGEMVYDFDPSEYYVNSNQEQFMNLLYDPLFYVTDKGNKSSANVSEISRAEGCEGGVFDNKIAAIFATDRNGAKDTISCTVPAIKDKDLSYYVSGVAAGNWKVTVNGKDCGTYTATEEGGLLTFSAPAGNIVISPVK